MNMGKDSGSDVRKALQEARQAGDRTKAAGRWFPSYLLFMGVVAFVWIVALEALFPSGGAGHYAVGVGGVGMGLLGWWADSHDVYPQGASRRTNLALALWFGGYLLVIGPLVRWQAGTSIVWWSVGAAVLASPFFIAAWRAGRRP
jgi:hypothetical protein